MTALIACWRNADLSGRKLIGQSKKSTVRTGVGAKAFLSQKIHRHEPANEQKRDRHRYSRKRLPKIRDHQMIGEFWNKRFMGSRKHSIHYGPDKHVQSAN